MEHWIDRDIKIYKNIFNKHNEKEIAISHCALSMVKILNGLSEMNHTEFYKYEKQMLWNAMSLFSEQCIEQINYALILNCKDTEQIWEKKEVISDIENSISQMMAVCKNIFDGTANAERQTFQSLSVDTNMYELSPKLCAFYSSMLEKVVTLFTKNVREYAFVMHPTLNSTIEAKLLLETRKKSGKVVIIYISESSIENFNLVPICLMHEAFHVLTRQERHRKHRAICFMTNIMEYIERSLFDNIILTNKNIKDTDYRQRLMDFWFKDISKLIEALKSESEDSQKFYSKNIVNELINTIRKCLANISNQLEETIFNFVCQESQQNSYISFQEDIELITNIKEKLRSNLDHIVLRNKVPKAADQLMFLFRETYADICCLLILHLKPEQYANAFLSSIQFDFDDKTYQDPNRRVREYLVAKIVSDILPENLHWKEYLLELEKQIYHKQHKILEETKNFSTYKEHSRQNNPTHDKIEHIVLSERMYQQFLDYLTECANDFNNRLDHIYDINSFRESVKAIITENSGNLLIDIFSENVIL